MLQKASFMRWLCVRFACVTCELDRRRSKMSQWFVIYPTLTRASSNVFGSFDCSNVGIMAPDTTNRTCLPMRKTTASSGRTEFASECCYLDRQVHCQTINICTCCVFNFLEFQDIPALHNHLKRPASFFQPSHSQSTVQAALPKHQGWQLFWWKSGHSMEVTKWMKVGFDSQTCFWHELL